VKDESVRDGYERLDASNDQWAVQETGDAVPLPPVVAEQPPVGTEEFEAAFGESLAHTLDLDTWELGENLAALYERLEKEVEDAVGQENRIRERIRKEVFPRLRDRAAAPRGAGVYQASVHEVEKVHKGLLFNGQVEACDGTSVVNETLPIGIAQIGVCLASYQGDRGSWVHRMFRRDLRVGGLDPVDEALEVLERRREQSSFEGSNRRGALSELARRGIMAYAERAVLLHKSQAPWRMGPGSPAPYELLTGSGMKDLLASSLDLMDRLITGHKRFVFVPSSANSMFLTIGNALRPLEFAVIDTMQDVITRIVRRGHYRGEWADLVDRVEEFGNDVGSKVAIGVYRASAMAPAQAYYAHIDHVHEAALIALADSAMQEQRGFPMLIDLAHTICSANFGGDTIKDLTKLAYVEVGEPYRYLGERQTRR
jgi:hypothetical protein